MTTGCPDPLDFCAHILKLICEQNSLAKKYIISSEFVPTNNIVPHKCLHLSITASSIIA